MHAARTEFPIVLLFPMRNAAIAAASIGADGCLSLAGMDVGWRDDIVVARVIIACHKGARLPIDIGLRHTA